MRRVLLLSYLLAGTALAHSPHPAALPPSSKPVSEPNAAASHVAHATPVRNDEKNRAANDDNRFCVTTPKGKVNCILLPGSGH